MTDWFIISEKIHGVTLWLHPLYLSLNEKNPKTTTIAIAEIFLKELFLTVRTLLSIKYMQEMEIHGPVTDVGLFFSALVILQVLLRHKASTTHFQQVSHTMTDIF